MDQHTYPPMSDILRAESITLIEGYDPADLPDDIDLVVVGNVMRADYPIVKAVEERGFPITSGPAWLQDALGDERTMIAVSGTHGKTTTTTLITHLLSFAGKDPGFLVAGVPQDGQGSSALGQPPYFVIEADEYDTAFFDKRAKLLLYHSSKKFIWVVGNLEFDHADIYDSIEDIEVVFRQKAELLKAHDVAVIADDDPRVRDVMKDTDASVTTFALSSGDWFVNDKSADGSRFELCHRNDSSISVSWSMVGDHNVKNALAAAAVADACGCSLQQIADGLASFQGVKRRFEYLGEANGVSIYDDFAHHPTAIAYATNALRASMQDGRLIAVVYFASNTMSEGKHSAEDFKEALAAADQAVLLAKTDDISFLEDVSRVLPVPSTIARNGDELYEQLQAVMQPGDKVLFMGNRSMLAVQDRLITNK